MGIQNQYVIVFRQPEQSRSHERGYRQIKRPVNFFRRESPGLVLAGRSGKSVRSTTSSGKCNSGVMSCTGSLSTMRNAVRRVSCRRTISLRLRSKTSDLEMALHPDHVRDVIARAVGFQLIQEPQTLLGKR